MTEQEAALAPAETRAAAGPPTWVFATVLAALVLFVGALVYVQRSSQGFDTAHALAAHLDEQGAGCDRFRQDGPTPATGLCYVGGNPMVITIHESSLDTDSRWDLQLAAAKDQGIGRGMAMVLGDGWDIICYDKTYARLVAELLDAEYRAAP